MAPTEYAARNAYRLAAKRLTTACRDLDGHLPPPDLEEIMIIPPLWPTIRLDNTECEACATELDDLDEEQRRSHSCTHRNDSVSTDTRSEVQPRQPVRRRQPNAGVIRADIVTLDERFESFSVAISALASLLLPPEAACYDEHYIEWSDYRRWMKDRAVDSLALLEPDNSAVQTHRQNPGTVTNGNNSEMEDVVPSGSSGVQSVSDVTSVASMTSQQSSQGDTHAATVPGSTVLAASMPGLSTPAVPMPGTTATTYTNVVPHMSHTMPVTAGEHSRSLTSTCHWLCLS